jgi:hypothetical protein
VGADRRWGVDRGGRGGEAALALPAEGWRQQAAWLAVELGASGEELESERKKKKGWGGGPWPMLSRVHAALPDTPQRAVSRSSTMCARTPPV